jgi:hypothetical protein
MFPLKDDIPSRTFPFITVLLIALNILAFLYQISLGVGSPAAARAAQELIQEFGLIPCRLTGACTDPVAGLPSPYVTILSSSTAGSCTWAGTCSISGSSATTSRTRSAISASSSSTC